jgi:hypothetical protein
MRNAYILDGKPEGKSFSEDLIADGRTLLKCISEIIGLKYVDKFDSASTVMELRVP